MEAYSRLESYEPIGPRLPGTGPILGLMTSPEGVIAIRAEGCALIRYLLRNHGTEWEKITVH